MSTLVGTTSVTTWNSRPKRQVYEISAKKFNRKHVRVYNPSCHAPILILYVARSRGPLGARSNPVWQNGCFHSLGESVSGAGRACDTDPSNAILADTMKLLENSTYGKTVTNQERHMKTESSEWKLRSRFFSDEHFRAVYDLQGGIYEVESTKKSIQLNLPVHRQRARSPTCTPNEKLMKTDGPPHFSIYSLKS